MCMFIPNSAFTNFTNNLVAANNSSLLTYSSGGQNSKVDIPRQASSFQQVFLLFVGSEVISFLLPFLAFRGQPPTFLHEWPILPSLKQYISKDVISPVFPLPLSPTSKHSIVALGLSGKARIVIIFPSRGQVICHFKSPLPCYLRYPDVPGIRLQTSLGGSSVCIYTRGLVYEINILSGMSLSRPAVQEPLGG